MKSKFLIWLEKNILGIMGKSKDALHYELVKVVDILRKSANDFVGGKKEAEQNFEYNANAFIPRCDKFQFKVNGMDNFHFTIATKPKFSFFGTQGWHCLEILRYEKDECIFTEIKYNGLELMTYWLGEKAKDSLGDCIANSLFYDVLCLTVLRALQTQIVDYTEKILSSSISSSIGNTADIILQHLSSAKGENIPSKTEIKNRVSDICAALEDSNDTSTEK